MSELYKSRLAVLERIDSALKDAGRPSEACRLLAVSKTFPPEAIRLCHEAGQRAFGENYVQELEAKAAALGDLADLEWHFIGPLQSNKTRPVAETAHWVHSIDRAKIAERLSAQRPAALPPLQVCLQVNVSGEASKSGCAPSELPALAAAVAALPNLRLRGLMCIPESDIEPTRLAAQFASLRRCLEQLARDGYPLDTLSMGMSSDLEVAIREGATVVRVGTALFGHRAYPA